MASSKFLIKTFTERFIRWNKPNHRVMDPPIDVGTPGGYFITSNTGRSMPIFGVCELQHGQKFNIRVHKSEKRKNRGIWCGPPKYWTQYLGSPKR